MSDYLWDKTGSDPEVERLEELLAPLRHEGEPPREERPAAHRTVRVGWALAAAALLAVGIASTLDRGPTWELTQLEGASVCRGEVCDIGEGDWIETDAETRAMLEVADIGHMEVAPETRLRLVATSPDEHRLELVEGRIDAAVIAPPRLLIVDTPAATAVDLGCAYSLEVHENGAGKLIVSSGWVALESEDYVAFVVAGSEATMDPDLGPGTPVFWDASTELLDAVADWDANGGSPQPLMDHSRPRDTLTLWHVLQRTPSQDVADRIAALAPDAHIDPAVLDGDVQALEALRLELEPLWY